MRQPKPAARAATAMVCSVTGIGITGTEILAESANTSDPSTTVTRFATSRADCDLGESTPRTVFGVVSVKAIANPSSTGAFLGRLLVARLGERNGRPSPRAALQHDVRPRDRPPGD